MTAWEFIIAFESGLITGYGIACFIWWTTIRECSCKQGGLDA